MLQWPCRHWSLVIFWQLDTPAMSDLSNLKDSNLVLAVCGGIAAYKVADLVSKLVQAKASVTVCMTENAQHFVTPLTFQALTHRPVHTTMWHGQGETQLDHLAIAENADLIVVAPATANVLAKVAHGLCDDLVSTLICAAPCPVLFAPAMNTRMWQNPITQSNVAILKQHKYRFIGPEDGFLAERTTGPGRLADVPNILNAISETLASRVI